MAQPHDDKDTNPVYLMDHREQRVYEACRAAFPMQMQTVVAVRRTLSGHWQLRYQDGHWSLVVSMHAAPMGVGGLTHLGDDTTLSKILELLD